jgi:hypothetical protein
VGHVVAFLDQSTCKIYPNLSEVPEEAVAFSSPEELAKAASTEALDAMRKALIGQDVGTSSSREQAAQRLWYVLSLGGTPEVSWSSWDRKRVLDNLGNNKIADTSKIEVIQLTYVAGKDHMADFFFKKLPKQAKLIMSMLIEDGRGIWTNEEANAIIAKRANEIETRQDPMRIFSYYKGEFFRKKLMRRMTFAEFAAHPELSGTTL